MISMGWRKAVCVVLIFSLFYNFWPASSVSAETPVTMSSVTPVTERYTISNNYISVSGINGTIDSLRVDKDGGSNYSVNIIKTGQNFYMYANINGAVNTSASTQGEWIVSGNKLTITDVQFGSTGVTGDWTITLNGDTMQNSFSINNMTGLPVKLLSSGYKLEIPFEKGGYDVTDNTKTLFSKYISSTDMYIDARGQKRVTADWVLDMPGTWIHAFGTNGYDLRFYPSQQVYSPYNHADYQEMRFFSKDWGDLEAGKAGLAAGAQLTSTLDIKVYVPGVFTIPDSYPVFTSSDTNFASSLNSMFYERSFGWWGSHTAGDWKEWMLMQRSWVDSYVRDVEREELLNMQQEPEGAIWSWGDRKTWPFGPNHTTSTTNYINGAYRYFMATGDEQFLKASIDKMRKATNNILSFYNKTDKVFIIDDGVHTGLNTQGGGNNYYDITPYGHKDAYYNIYAYQAIKNMADLENMLGDTARGTELTNLAQDVNTGFNNIFWNGNVYIQVIDVNGVSHNYDATYLNFEAINYGLATPERANHIIDYFTDKVSGSGQKDIFSKWVIAPRSYGDLNANNRDGGWWISIYNPLPYDDQVQYGGTIFFYAYYEMMSRIHGKDADNAYGRLKQIMKRFNLEDHLSGGEPLINGETMQHGKEGSLGLWGEFPENGIVPTIALYGFMGTEMDKDGLHFTPNLPTELETLGIQKFNYNGMNLTIDTTATSVRIQTTDTSPYSWKINDGTTLTAPFDVTTTIAPGGTVTLQKATGTTIDLNTVPAGYIKVTRGAADDNISNNHTFITYEPMNSGLNAYTFSSTKNGIGGYIAEIEKPDGTKLYTDSSWKTNSTPQAGWESDNFDDTTWSNAQSLGGYGVSPFGNTITEMNGTKGQWIWSDTNNNTISAKSVTAATYSSLVGWGASKLTDGNTGTVWSSNIYSEANNTEEYVTLDLGTMTNTSQINIVPRELGYGFPKDFSFQFSNDGTNWNDIRGLSYEDYVNPGSAIQTFMFPDNIASRYLRMKATKLGTDDLGKYVFQLAEIGVGSMEEMPKGKKWSNVSRYSASGYEANSVIPGWDLTRLGDGNTGTSYSSGLYALGTGSSHTEWVSVDLGAAKTIGTVAIAPRSGGLSFPVDFKIQTSMDKVNWTDTHSYTNYKNPGGALQTFSFPTEQTARYVRVYATKLGGDGGSYAFQLAEIYLSPEKPLTAIASSGNAADAVDGDTGNPWLSKGYPGANNIEWITVDMRASRFYDTINVVPRNVLANATSNGFPQNFVFQYSNDAVNWTDIPGESYQNYPIMPKGKQVFKLINPVKSRYMRMYATKLSRDDQGIVNYSFQLADLGTSYSGSASLRKTFYGTTNNQPLTASGASSSLTVGWEASNVIDNNPSSNWSSLGHVGANVTESVYVDAGSTQTIEQIRLLPRTGGYGFPVDFKFQSSTDETNWTDIPGLSYTNYGDPGDQIEQTYALGTLVSARYVRLYVTRLGKDESGANVVQIADFAIDTEVNPDQTPPVTTGDAPEGWTNQDVTVMLTAVDEESGVAVTQYRINEGEWLTYREPVVITTEGITTFAYRSIDKAGNTENVKTLTIQLDKTAPTATVSYGPVTAQSVIAAITQSEPVTITNNGGSSSYTFYFNGSFTFEFVDAAGNQGTSTATVNNIILKSKAKPITPNLSDNNGYDTGLQDGTYNVTMNMWYGENGRIYKLYENDVLIDTKILTDNSPNAQATVTSITYKKNGTYRYYAELTNAFGTMTSSTHVVTVTKAAPDKPVLSNDNWDGDGNFKVNMNLWWGTNGTTYNLYENGVLIYTQALVNNTPAAQAAVATVTNKAIGTYEYRGELVNYAGAASSDTMIVNVTK